MTYGTDRFAASAYRSSGYWCAVLVIFGWRSFAVSLGRRGVGPRWFPWASGNARGVTLSAFGLRLFATLLRLRPA